MKCNLLKKQTIPNKYMHTHTYTFNLHGIFAVTRSTCCLLLENSQKRRA